MTNDERNRADRLDRPWERSNEEILRVLCVDADRGLTSQEIADRRRTHGENRLREARPKSAWAIFAAQFRSLIALLLVAAAGLSFGFSQWVEGGAILAVVLLNAAIGFATELQAVRSMEALRRLGHVRTRVRRGGRIEEVPAEDLVLGDIVIVEGGDVVTADLRLIDASKLQVDESPLTGESSPVDKTTAPLPADAPLADRTNMLFKGTAITRGSAMAIVVAAGMQTELGRISSLVETAEDTATPLEIRLAELGRGLIAATLGIAAAAAVSGILRGRELFAMIETSVVLAVAAIPEGLPIVATIALARGMWRMARRNALVNRLSAVETLGSAQIICTDKTGTLTENRLTASRILLPSETLESDRTGWCDAAGRTIDPDTRAPLRELLEVGVLCNNASISSDRDRRGVGDPLEVALLAVGNDAGIDRDALRSARPEVREEAFDPESKRMATVHRRGDRFQIAVKGAPESILPVSSSVLTGDEPRPLDDRARSDWLDRAEALAEDGLRVLALATRSVESEEEDPYRNLTLLGIIGFLDPPRAEVRDAIDQCRTAGIRTVMVTGDQPATALSIARAVGLVETDDGILVHGRDLPPAGRIRPDQRDRILRAAVFARVSPGQKLDLISLYQESGAVVAMTGDGVNDAPALKKADIGIAMGRRGTQVAREAADIVLMDDAFSSIVAAVEQGRVVFGNLRKFVLYLISCNVSEILSVFIASVAGIPLPLLPLQILFLNLVTDVFPALALGVGRGDPAQMHRPPRDSQEPILGRRHWLGIGGHALSITAAVLGGLMISWRVWGAPEPRAGTISFLTLAFAQLWHVLNMRDRDAGRIRNEISGNPFVWGALTLCSGLLLAAVYLPGLAGVLRVVRPTAAEWGLIIGMSLLPVAIGQLRPARRPVADRRRTDAGSAPPGRLPEGSGETTLVQ